MEDLILIPKQLRAWFDAGMALFVFAALVCLPVYIMICDGVDGDLLTVAGAGVVVTLLFSGYIHRGLRRGYITKVMYSGPVAMLKGGAIQVWVWAKKAIDVVTRWLKNHVAALVVGVVLLAGVCGQTYAGQYEVERIAYARQVIQLIKSNTTPVIHLGYIKSYVFKSAKGFYFMLGDKNVTVDEFEAWLNKFDENDINQVKMLIAFEREFTYWPLHDELVVKTWTEIKKAQQALIDDAEGK